MNKIWIQIAFCFVIVWLVACDALFPVSILKILQNPRDYAGKEVQVSGTVDDTFSIFFLKYFVIRDDTGKLVIITEKPLPRKGDKAKVKGKIEEAFSLGDQQMIVMIENSEN